VPPTPALLVLWDVDRTLIDAASVDKDVWLEVCARLTGAAVTRPDGTSGRTDPEILLSILRTAEGIDETHARALLPEALRLEAEILAGRRDELARRGRDLPGARAALEALARIPHLTQTLVTGNVRRNAQTKLAAFRLDHLVDLSLGGYGSDNADRAQLIRLARRRASAARHTVFTPATTVVLGDSPRDIQAARTAGARVVAVATGRPSAADLRRARPDALLPDLRDTAAVLRAVLTPADPRPPDPPDSDS
jgi:phosphoglycolate phosphatase-like HAD superfamily hydrolase